MKSLGQIAYEAVWHYKWKDADPLQRAIYIVAARAVERAVLRRLKSKKKGKQ